MAEVRPALPGHFDDVYPLLLGFRHATMSRDDWRRMLFDLPWPVDEPHRGHILYDRGRAVGFLGTIFSHRTMGGRKLRFCNLSSWVVEDSYRSSSFELLLHALGTKTHTIVNLSASASVHEIFTRLGFRTLEDSQVLLPPLARPREILRGPRCRILTRTDAVRAQLDHPGREILDQMSGTLAAQVVIQHGGRSCHLVATRSPWKGRWRLAHVQYASDWGMLFECPSAACLAFYRVFGPVGLRVDGRRAPRRLPRFAVRRALPLPALYRPAEPDITPDLIDGLYTEVVGQRW